VIDLALIEVIVLLVHSMERRRLVLMVLSTLVTEAKEDEDLVEDVEGLVVIEETGHHSEETEEIDHPSEVIEEIDHPLEVIEEIDHPLVVIEETGHHSEEIEVIDQPSEEIEEDLEETEEGSAEIEEETEEGSVEIEEETDSVVIVVVVDLDVVEVEDTEGKVAMVELVVVEEDLEGAEGAAKFKYINPVA